jgi:branched-chain amino acid transport system substrate-binding protein
MMLLLNYKTNMKKIIYGVLAIVVVGIISVGFINSDNIDDESPFKIGLVLPLSGGASFLGESAQKAAQLAIKDAGETKYNYELLFEDDGFSPVKTVSAVNKLINVDNVSALVTFGSGTSNAVAQINEDAQVTRFGLASDPVSVEGDYNFIHWTPAYKEGELLAQELVNRGYKKVSIVDTNHSGTLAVTNSVRESLASTDVEVVSYDLTNVGDTDFRTMAQKIKNNE